MLWLTDHFRDSTKMIESANNFSIQYVFKFMRLWCKKDNTCERTQDAGALPVKRKSAAVSQLAEGADLSALRSPLIILDENRSAPDIEKMIR